MCAAVLPMALNHQESPDHCGRRIRHFQRTTGLLMQSGIGLNAPVSEASFSSSECALLVNQPIAVE